MTLKIEFMLEEISNKKEENFKGKCCEISHTFSSAKKKALKVRDEVVQVEPEHE